MRGTSGITPLVDSILSDPLRVPGDVADWLRGIERMARALCAETGRALQQGNPTHAMARAHAQLTEFLADERRSAFRRTIRRPLRQLEDGRPARETLRRLAADLFRRAAEALDTHDAVMSLVQRIADVRAAYTDRMPSLSAEHWRQGRVDDQAVADIRSVRDVELIRRRVDRIEEALASYATEIPADRVSELALQRVVRREGITLAELYAAYRLRLRARGQLRISDQLHGEVRALTVRHLVMLQRLADAGDPSAAERVDAGAAVLEQLVDQAVDRQASASVGGSVPLFVGAVAGLHNAVYPRADRYAWRPPAGLLNRHLNELQAADAAQAPDAGAVLYIVPIGGEYVCVTSAEPSPVRVYSRVVREGSQIEGQVVVPNGTMEDTEANRLDLLPLIDGFEQEESAWYKTVRRVRVEVLAEEHGRWFGRVEQRGRVAVVDTPAWKARAPSAGAFRILRRPAAPVGGERSSVSAPRAARELGVSPVGPVTFCLGAATVAVRAPLAGHELAWLRYSADSSAHATQSIETEAALFRALGHTAQDNLGRRRPLGIEVIGRGKPPAHGRGGVLYRTPRGLRPADAPTLAAWIKSSPDAVNAVLTGVAEIIAATHTCGYVLATCTAEMFAFRAAWGALNAPAIPEPLLVTAPVCTREGDRLRSPAGVGYERERYEQLGLTVLTPPVTAGDRASPDADAWAFAAFASDLLLRAPLVTADGLPSWSNVWTRLANLQDSDLLSPRLVRGIAHCMQTADGRQRVISLIHLLASSHHLDEVAAVGLFETL